MNQFENLIDGDGYYINESKNYPGFFFVNGRVSDETFQTMAGFYRKALTLPASDIVNITKLHLEATKILKGETSILREKVIAEQKDFFSKVKSGNCQFRILSDEQNKFLTSLKNGTEYIPKAERTVSKPKTKTKASASARA